MTPLEMAAEVLRLDAEATPGEWWVDTANWHGLQYGVTSDMGVICPCREHAANDDKHNAALIAHYRTAAPTLARECQRLAAELAKTTLERNGAETAHQIALEVVKRQTATIRELKAALEASHVDE